MFYFAVISTSEIVYFIVFVFFIFLLLIAFFGYSIWVSRTTTTLSPYTGLPLRSGAEINWMTAEKVLRFLYNMNDYHNRMFDVTRAGFCRETGRLFPDALNWYGVIKVDWSFLNKRFPGRFVSWGSLTEDQKLKISDRHRSLEGFQTKYSSSTPSPRKLEPLYAYAKPGPLYVDVDTGVLLGWKCVPDTELEVLIVQKPQEIYIPGINKKY